MFHVWYEVVRRVIKEGKNREKYTYANTVGVSPTWNMEHGTNGQRKTFSQPRFFLKPPPAGAD
jgi:hypothetical protein